MGVLDVKLPPLDIESARLFSCCCARVDVSWVFRTVCDCYRKHFRCDNQCLTDALVQDSLFYSIGVVGIHLIMPKSTLLDLLFWFSQKLVNDLRTIYPSANIWLVGHSLGGSVASLLGATYGLPVVAFEAPGEKLAAIRLHLPLPPPVVQPHSSQLFVSQRQNLWSWLPYLRFTQPRGVAPTQSHNPVSSSSHHPVATTHVYHTADPIPQGTCSGFRSPCAQAGYALETRCHLGQSIIFDTVQRLKWKVDVRKHVIKTLVMGVLEGEIWWGDDEEEEGGDDTVVEGEGEWQSSKRKAVVPRPIIESDCLVSANVYIITKDSSMTDMFVRIATSGSLVISTRRG